MHTFQNLCTFQDSLDIVSSLSPTKTLVHERREAHIITEFSTLQDWSQLWAVSKNGIVYCRYGKNFHLNDLSLNNFPNKQTSYIN